MAALRGREDWYQVLDAMADPEKITVVQVAPAVRTAWGESFGLSRDFATAKRLVAALVSDGSLSEEDVAELSAMFRVADDE